MKEKATRKVTLAELVRARQLFLETIIPCIEFLVHTHGEVLDHKVRDCYTTTTRELNNVRGFSFYTYGSFTMFGGRNVIVYYHPHGKKGDLTRVLDVDYWDIQKCHVKTFDASLVWQHALQQLCLDKEQVQHELQRRKQQEQEVRGKEAQQYRDAAQVEEDARRLKLI
ncbi:MAG: hypothetical protein KGI50_00485 [Patescibacteria group bacterium]|nr:hypothetical protein [Patescibacteria group bacterium]MDE2438167.1 hypothetical protein [Patescibacteria group bacterium]